MRFARPGRSESALAAHFEYLCALSGAQRPAYVPVIASGCVLRTNGPFRSLIVVNRSNSLVLHYTRNDQLVEEGELVLMDAGCEYQ
jgi:intermediate cleaving peptidase 55